MPVGPTEETWTGGGTSEASIFVRTVGRSGACRGWVEWIGRSDGWLRSWPSGCTAEKLGKRLHGRGRRKAARRRLFMVSVLSSFGHSERFDYVRKVWQDNRAPKKCNSQSEEPAPKGYILRTDFEHPRHFKLIMVKLHKLPCWVKSASYLQ